MLVEIVEYNTYTRPSFPWQEVYPVHVFVHPDFSGSLLFLLRHGRLTRQRANS